MDSPKHLAIRPGRLTRRRLPLSCGTKLKCNREKPCQNCVARGDSNAASCAYAEKTDKKIPGQLDPQSDLKEMRKRLNRLESSILSIMSSDAGKIRDRASEVRNEDMLAGPQRISVDTRSTAWDAILNEIGGMKEAWSEDNDKIELTDSAHRSYCTAREHQPGILAGLTAPPDRFTILQSLPSREAADRQVPFFSANLHYSLAMLTMSFTKEPSYDSQHWANPSKTSIIWIGLLYSILCLAMQSYNRSPDDAPHEYQENGPELAELYRLQTAQCLVIADITKPTEFMIETLDLHSFAEYDTEQDGDIGTAMLSGIMMRLALQQGFHRDPSQLPGLSIFQGEMRRRIWSAVNQHELLWSVQIGLPKAIRYSESDTQAPRILYEEELYEEMTELPPCRPLTTDTEVCYQVFKWQLMRCYGRVVEFVHIIEPQPYEEVLKLDLMLLEVHEAIPFHLQFGTLEQMKNDPNSRIMEKFILKSFWHKSVCILHRKYWDTAPSDTPQNSRWVYSRKASLGSALSMLEMQYTMHQACAPGGLMSKMKWYHFSITNHDFLLAAMIICLDLMSVEVPECVMPPEQKLDAIRRSRAIWQSIANDCRDAKRAMKVLTAVLDKLSKKYTYLTQVTSAPASASLGNMSQTASPNFMPGGFAPGNNQILGKGYQHVDSQGYNTYFTDCVGVGMSSSPEGFSNSNLSNPNGDSLMQDNFLDAFSTDLTIPSDFDWNGWDQFLAGQSLQLNQDLAGRFGAQMGNGGMDFM
ncbi:uncharacterized protein RCO7_00770 [Rhynchosporium graminicola]|uniref:Xylanolytic transcriptional activator regulatory domain-containing protein n=1 Tax=Rhynchosporium graminicola TaxID=2792576 RepID=A0A1E1K2P3_9HELO|nr:uncharacterized protein RCO7_00770 [Rhynchosporium commune]